MDQVGGDDGGGCRRRARLDGSATNEATSPCARTDDLWFGSRAVSPIVAESTGETEAHKGGEQHPWRRRCVAGVVLVLEDETRRDGRRILR